MKLNELSKQEFSGKHILIILIFSLFTFTLNAQQSGNQIAKLLTDAETAYASGDYGTALYSYQKVLRLKGSDAAVQQKIESITKMLDEKPEVLAQQIENAIIKGEDLLKKNDYPAAKKEFEKALALDPSSQYPLDKLSQIRQKYTDPDDAGNYEAAVQKAADLMKAYKYDEAIQWYNIARSANPEAKLPIEKIAEARRLEVEYEANRVKYDVLIKQADKQLADSKREDALKTYTDALALFPDEKYPKDKLTEINNWFADKKAQQDAYEAAVNAGDDFYINRDFTNARIKYQEALKVKPDARYPKDMLEKTRTGEAQLASVREKYDNLISSADKFYAASDWDAAKQGYTTASELLPGEEYPKTQIGKIEKIKADQLSKKQQYDNLISEGDAFFAKNDYTGALTKYKTAQPLQPQETYPATKINEINKLIADKQALETGYSNAIKLADAALAKKDYTIAKKSFNDALGFKPEESYPKDKLAEIEKIEESNRSLEENYTAVIAKADQFFASENWQEALNSYKEASNLKPEEKYPKTKIAEATAKIDALDKQNKSYNDLITAADAAFGNGEFSIARTKYNGALAVKPNENYPKEKLAEIEIKLADAAKLDADYKTALETGAELFGKNDLPGALSAYKTAALIKPAEKLPVQKIDEINKMLAANQAKDENYSSLIQQADKAFADGDLSGALAKYTSASAIKPSEEYPKQKIADINKTLAAQKAIDDQYLPLIASADKLYETSKYDEAIAEYGKALNLKPAEKYPSEQIAAINDIVAKNKSIDEQYQQAVAEGDKLFASKNYDEARSKFDNAAQLKNKEKYPQQKLAEIDLLLNEIKTKNNNYEQAVKSGDDFFNQTKYREALEPYQRANTVKPEEKYPLDQIARINDTLNMQAKQEEDFKALVAQADKSFTDKKYDEAKGIYTKSLLIKPLEKYPAEKITEINGILGKQQETQDNFNKLIAEGDVAFTAADFEKALTSYNDALKLLPGEKSAQDKIASAQAEIKKRDDNYNSQIAAADKAFTEKNYSSAIDLYNKALQIKPKEKYPSDKIVDISSILQKQKDTRDAFDKLIAEGDVAFTAADFEKALTSYNDALKLLPGEKSAQDKIASAEAEIKKRDDNYNSQIAAADKAFTEKNYSSAIDLYNKALQIKPKETYPGQQIQKITDLLAQQKEEQERLYNNYISNGDALMASQDLINARTEYNKALSIKPNEKYPTDKVIAINTELAARSKAAQAEYDKIIVEADKYYQGKVLDQALEQYTKAAQVKPDEAYPVQMISKIRQYITDHAFVSLNKQNFSLGSGDEKKFTFTAIEPRLKKNNYILIHAKASSSETVKVYLNYGKDGQKNGGVVLRNLSTNENDILVRISVQDRWYREDNNWISLNIEGGNFDVSRIDIIQGDE